MDAILKQGVSVSDGITRGPAGDTSPFLLSDMLEASAAKGPNKPCVSSEDGAALTYSEGLDLARKVSGGLHGAGFRKGDRIAICMPNHIAYPVLCQASWRGRCWLERSLQRRDS